MGVRRVGLKRLEGLMENLQRELQLSGSTICGLLGGSHGSFGGPPIVIDDSSGVADGDAADVVIHQYSDGLRLHVQNIGAQTILIPAAETTGMDYGYDPTNNEGIQWVASLSTHKGYPGVDRFTIGTHGPFYTEMQFSIEDVSGTDDCAFGFRKVESFAAAIDDYNDMAALNVISGDIKIETILNNAATTTTDTTQNWADGETHTLRIDVSATGVVTYKIDGATPTITAAFTFDSGDVVTPFFYFLNDTDVAGKIILKQVKWGLVPVGR